jgi:hypothetical protein
MKAIHEVDEARALMTEAINWSVMKWLGEKKRVRKAADLANDTLDRMAGEIKQKWSPALRAAYEEIKANPDKGKANGAASDLKAFALRVREADAEAYRIRMEAEDIFDKAERRLSTSMARDGCRKAIEGWGVHEKALQLAESGLSSRKTVA